MHLLIHTLTIVQDSLPFIHDTIAAVKPVVPETATADSLVLSRQALQALIAATSHEPSWTDRMQAYAAVVGTAAAVIAGVLGIWSLWNTFKQQKSQINDQQSQLKALSDIAKSHNQLIYRLASIAASMEGRRVQEYNKHLSEIRPYFHLKDYTYKTDNYTFMFSILNKGKTATNVKLECQSNTDLEVAPNTDDSYLSNRVNCKFSVPASIIDADEKNNIVVDISRLANYLELEETQPKKEFIIHLTYLDADGNNYLQIIEGKEQPNKGIGELTISKPQLTSRVGTYLA